SRTSPFTTTTTVGSVRNPSTARSENRIPRAAAKFLSTSKSSSATTRTRGLILALSAPDLLAQSGGENGCHFGTVCTPLVRGSENRALPRPHWDQPSRRL